MSPTVPKPGPKLPEHVAMIMDGNGRWAKRRGKSRAAGHAAGARRVREITTECARLGIRQLTLYALSAENYAHRPTSEVRALMGILRRYAVGERPTLMDEDVRFRVIGRLDELPARVVAEVRKTEQMTAANRGMTLCIAINYGGRTEIVDAVNAALEEARRAGTQNAIQLDEAAIARHLATAGQPELDLLVRTSGEMRISNFLLWQIAYAELYVTETLWPDFSRTALLEALLAYQKRDRRFGGLRTEAAAGAVEEPDMEVAGLPIR